MSKLSPKKEGKKDNTDELIAELETILENDDLTFPKPGGTLGDKLKAMMMTPTKKNYCKREEKKCAICHKKLNIPGTVYTHDCMSEFHFNCIDAITDDSNNHKTHYHDHNEYIECPVCKTPINIEGYGFGHAIDGLTTLTIANTMSNELYDLNDKLHEFEKVHNAYVAKMKVSSDTATEHYRKLKYENEKLHIKYNDLSKQYNLLISFRTRLGVNSEPKIVSARPRDINRGGMRKNKTYKKIID